MKRATGDIVIPHNFEVKKSAPLDSRSLVGTYLDLMNSNTWNNTNVYNGMTVTVNKDSESSRNTLYMLLDETDVTNEDSWKVIGSDGTGKASNSIIYVDPVFGNDLTGAKGIVHKPFKTLKGALTNLKGGELIWMQPGEYIISNGATLTSGVTDLTIFAEAQTKLTIREDTGNAQILFDLGPRFNLVGELSINSASTAAVFGISGSLNKVSLPNIRLSKFDGVAPLLDKSVSGGSLFCRIMLISTPNEIHFSHENLNIEKISAIDSKIILGTSTNNGINRYDITSLECKQLESKGTGVCDMYISNLEITNDTGVPIYLDSDQGSRYTINRLIVKGVYTGPAITIGIHGLSFDSGSIELQGEGLSFMSDRDIDAHTNIKISHLRCLKNALAISDLLGTGNKQITTDINSIICTSTIAKDTVIKVQPFTLDSLSSSVKIVSNISYIDATKEMIGILYDMSKPNPKTGNLFWAYNSRILSIKCGVPIFVKILEDYVKEPGTDIYPGLNLGDIKLISTSSSNKVSIDCSTLTQTDFNIIVTSSGSVYMNSKPCDKIIISGEGYSLADVNDLII